MTQEEFEKVMDEYVGTGSIEKTVNEAICDKDTPCIEYHMTNGVQLCDWYCGNFCIVDHTAIYRLCEEYKKSEEGYSPERLASDMEWLEEYIDEEATQRHPDADVRWNTFVAELDKLIKFVQFQDREVELKKFKEAIKE